MRKEKEEEEEGGGRGGEGGGAQMPQDISMLRFFLTSIIHDQESSTDLRDGPTSDKKKTGRGDVSKVGFMFRQDRLEIKAADGLEAHN